ncbi:MAG: hypothetical protein ACRDYA_10895 [Egibacteraceae bacterium]
MLATAHDAAVAMDESFRERSAGLGRAHPLHEAAPPARDRSRHVSLGDEPHDCWIEDQRAGAVLRACFPRQPWCGG